MLDPATFAIFYSRVTRSEVAALGKQLKDSCRHSSPLGRINLQVGALRSGVIFMSPIYKARFSRVIKRPVCAACTIPFYPSVVEQAA